MDPPFEGDGKGFGFSRMSAADDEGDRAEPAGCRGTRGLIERIEVDEAAPVALPSDTSNGGLVGRDCDGESDPSGGGVAEELSAGVTSKRESNCGYLFINTQKEAGCAASTSE